MNVVQIPIAPLITCGVVTVALVAGLSLVVWLWAMRKPRPTEIAVSATAEMPTPVYVAVGAQIGLGLDSGGVEKNWADLLREKMPEGTRLVLLGRRGITLAELNKVEIPKAVAARPDIVTLWSVVSDATKGVELAAYIKELHQALATLLRGSEVEVMSEAHRTRTPNVRITASTPIATASYLRIAINTIDTSTATTC